MNVTTLAAFINGSVYQNKESASNALQALQLLDNSFSINFDFKIVPLPQQGFYVVQIKRKWG